MISLIITFIIIFITIFISSGKGNLSINFFINYESLLIVILPSIILSIYSYSIKDFFQLFKKSNKDNILVKIKIVQTMESQCINLGYFGTLYHLIITFVSLGIFSNQILDSHYIGRLGLSMGMSLLPLLYGLFFSYILLKPTRIRFLNKSKNLI